MPGLGLGWARVLCLVISIGVTHWKAVCGTILPQAFNMKC